MKGQYTEDTIQMDNNTEKTLVLINLDKSGKKQTSIMELSD